MLVKPLVRPIVRAIAVRSTGSPGSLYLPPATHYVSQSASNDYALGVNSGAGTTKAAPWLTLEYAITNAPDGSVIYVNDGTYTPATFFNCTKNLTIVSPRRRQVVLRAAPAQVRVFNFQAASGTFGLTLIGLVIDAQSNSTSCVTVGSAAHTSVLTLTMRDCLFKDAVTNGLYTVGQKAMNVTVKDCEYSAAGTTTQALLRFENIESGAVVVSGFAFSATSASTILKSVVTLTATAASVTASIRGIVGTYIDTSASGAGVNGVIVENVNNAVIEGNNITIQGASAHMIGAVYRIRCTNGALTANNGIIRHNTGFNNTQGGYCAIIGEDFTSAGDNRHNNGLIYENTFTANSSALAFIHGLMLGYGTGGSVYRNTVSGAGLAAIAKQQIGGEFYENTITQAKSQALRAKGSTNTEFRNNTVTLSASFAGEGFTADSNTAPATNSTGIIASGNVFNVTAAPTAIVWVTASNTATFSTNTYNITATLGADSWRYQGVNYQTLAAWKAVEPTALP